MIIDYLFKNRKIIIFNVKRDSHYTDEYFPLIPCDRKAFGLSSKKE